MSGFTLSLLAFIVAISVLVAVHEFGHFWVARRLGVKVLRFSIGFGKPIWLRHFGADRTEFAIAAVPLGGYVKMLDERDATVAPGEVRRAFNRQPLATRSAVILAGPLFNILFAVFAYWLMFVTGVPGLKPIIGEVAPSTAAAQAGFVTGDEVLDIAGTPTPTWDAASLELTNAALESARVDVRVRRSGGGQRILSLDFARLPHALDKGGVLQNLGLSLWHPPVPAVVDRLIPGGAAEKGGLEPGDRVVAVDGHPVKDWDEWVEYVRGHPMQALAVEVERGQARVSLTLTPGEVKEDGKTIGRIGAYVRVPQGQHAATAEVRYGPFAAIGKAFGKTWEMSALTVRTLWGMLSGRASVENISGPISIAQYAGYSARIGPASFLRFLAIVSISLGVLNLLPVPVLDGGHLLYNLVEWVRGRPLSEHAQHIGQQVGIVALLVLMSIAFYNDISRLFGA